MDSAESKPAAFESTPLTRAEYIAAMVHFYRAELSRSTQWRIRLDTTTNWSILSVMAVVTFALGDSQHTHVGILVGMGLVLTFLVIEARRFRFYDVSRSRVRMLEENFVGPIVRRDLVSPIKDWGRMVADDLQHPHFKLTWHQALRVRLARNYLPMFGLLLASWAIKLNAVVTSGDAPAKQADWHTAYQRMGIGAIPPWVSLALVIGFYGYLVGVLIFVQTKRISNEEYWQEVRREARVIDF
jgi:uncharacterized membrane protein